MTFQDQLKSKMQQSSVLTEEQTYQKCINKVYDGLKLHILQKASQSQGGRVLSGEYPFSTSIGYTEDSLQKMESNLYYLQGGSESYLYLRKPCDLKTKSGFTGTKASISITSAGYKYIQDLERLALADRITLSFKPLYTSANGKKTLSNFNVFESIPSTHLPSATLLICWQVSI